MIVRKWLYFVLILAILMFVAGKAAADPIFSYEAKPDVNLLSFKEGEFGVVSYTLTNTGNRPLYTFSGGYVLYYMSGDVLDFPILFGEAGPPDGAFLEVLPGESFQYKWLFGAIDDGDWLIDFGWWLFIPTFVMAEAPFRVDGWWSRDGPSNGIWSVLIQVNDISEPSSLLVFGAGFLGLSILRRNLKAGALPPRARIVVVSIDS